MSGGFLYSDTAGNLSLRSLGDVGPLVRFTVTPGERIEVRWPAPSPPPYVPGCRCGCSDGRRVR